MSVKSESGRLTRHLVTPLVIILVDLGYIPEAAQHDLIEAGVIIAAFAVAYGYSWWQDRQAGLT